MGYSGGNSGISVRVAKGVTLRTGAMRGHAVKDEVSVASGELVVTDQRVVFSGDRKSFAISLNSLLNVTNYADGFALSDSRSTYTLRTPNSKDRLVFATVVDKVVQGRRENAD